jgi:hypothetical protein
VQLDAFDSSVPGSSDLVGLVGTRPDPSAWPSLKISTEASLLFETIYVLPVAPDKLATRAQIANKSVCVSRIARSRGLA